VKRSQAEAGTSSWNPARSVVSRTRIIPASLAVSTHDPFAPLYELLRQSRSSIPALPS
jgi:hypothetical protein